MQRRKTSMSEITDCLPHQTKKHYINLRNIHQESGIERYQSGLRSLKADLAARGLTNSGMMVAGEWRLKEELSDALAEGFLQAAFETLRLYEFVLTASMRDCMERAVEDQLTAFWKNALTSFGQGLPNSGIPLNVEAADGGPSASAAFQNHAEDQGNVGTGDDRVE